MALSSDPKMDIPSLIKVGDVLMLKSGSEFREFSQLTISLPPKDVARLSGPRLILDVTHHEVRSEISPHPEMEAIVKKYLLKVRLSPSPFNDVIFILSF